MAQKTVQGIKLLVRVTLHGHIRKDMDSRKTIAGGELCVSSQHKKVEFKIKNKKAKL